MASRQVAVQARTADPADIDAWWDRVADAVLRIVAIAAGATATLAVRYLREHAAIEGVRLDPVRSVPPAEQLATSLLVMGPVAFKRHMRVSGSPEASLRVMAGQLAGTASSRALDGDRETVMATFAERDEVVGWRRQLNSPNPCAFCAMLASRGAVYSKNTGSFQAHKPRCWCTAEPLYRHEPEPDDVVALRKLWQDSTAGLHGMDALRAFRRAYDAAPPLLVARPDREADEPDDASAPAFEPYPSGLSQRQAQEWMIERWGTDDIGRRAILLDGLGPTGANDMAATMNELLATYPETAKRIRAFGASAPVTKAVNQLGRGRLRNISGRAYADAARSIGSLRVSGPKARKSDELKAMLTRDVQIGWHPPGTDSLAAVVRHEFGHFLYWVAQERGGADVVGRELEDAMAEAIGEERGSAEWFRRRYDLTRSEISRYATTNGDELMAEAFAYVTSSAEPSPLASALVEVLVRHAEG